MSKITLVLLFLVFSHLSDMSLAESIKLKEQIKKIDRGLYRGVDFNEGPGEIDIDLSLAKPRDGYSSESISICTSAEKCAESNWDLVGERNYFVEPYYTEMNSFELDGIDVYTAFGPCQISDEKWGISMAGKCFTIMGRKKNKKFFYNSYLGRASGCRPDSKCWQKSAKRRIEFISNFLKVSEMEIFEQSK
ncbi:hypothetical protein [Aquitalea magnusonii]|uniref:hypothetical protein n=1 Tax=Aquitalea magnusonii TaxID=332411 RepID=UPI000B5D029E|nr:hypothetical protein [Aquitalea magnusonii]